MHYLKLFLACGVFMLSGCAGMMTAMQGAEAMKNGTQAEVTWVYIKNAGGRAAFDKLDAMELSMLCSMYATSGKISSYIDCTETVVQRFKQSSDAATHFMVLNSHSGLALSFNGLGRYMDANRALDRGLAILEEKNLRDHYLYGELIKTAEIELHGFKAVTAGKLGDERAEQEALQFVNRSMPWLDEQGVNLLAGRKPVRK